VTEQVVAGPALQHLVEVLADNKQMLGRRYAEWCTAAPTLESAVAAAAMAQDEIGHARSFYPVLDDVAGKSIETDPETRTRRVNAAFLDHPFGGWTDFVAANFLFDTALTVLLDAARSSSFGPLAQRARRIHEEEALHWLHGEGWVRRLATKGDSVRSALASSCDAVRPDCLDLFDAAVEELVTDGVVEAGAEELRSRFCQRVQDALEACNLRPM
jgi:ring-1,2-phenylacetyl-CoA epoxidase subunit PaaC